MQILVLLFLMIEATAAQDAGEKPRLDGYCPVTVIQSGKWLKGNQEFQVVVDGATYHCLNEEVAALLRNQPGKFCPVLHGRCITCYVDEKLNVNGKVEFSVILEQRLFLFPTAAARDLFLRDPTKYKDKDLALNGMCPVCAKANLSQAGSPEFCEMFRGFRVYFANEQALTDFRSAPESFLR